jgi:putative transposase
VWTRSSSGNGRVDNWLLRACAVLGIRLVHSRPGQPQGRGKIERWFRTVRDQFLVEIDDSTADHVHDTGMTPAGALLLQLERVPPR